jgi:hypothetical protein
MMGVLKFPVERLSSFRVAASLIGFAINRRVVISVIVVAHESAFKVQIRYKDDLLTLNGHSPIDGMMKALLQDVTDLLSQFDEHFLQIKDGDLIVTIDTTF